MPSWGPCLLRILLLLLQIPLNLGAVHVPPDYLMQLYRATTDWKGRVTAPAPYYADTVLAYLDEGAFFIVLQVHGFIMAISWILHRVKTLVAQSLKPSV